MDTSLQAWMLPPAATFEARGAAGRSPRATWRALIAGRRRERRGPLALRLIISATFRPRFSSSSAENVRSPNALRSTVGRRDRPFSAAGAHHEEPTPCHGSDLGAALVIATNAFVAAEPAPPAYVV